MDTWYDLAREGDRPLILRFLAVVLRDPKKGLAWLGRCWRDLLFLERPEIAKVALEMVPWDEGNPAPSCALRPGGGVGPFSGCPRTRP